LSKLAVLLLAAGSSSRMGVPKQLLKWNNTTLLNHAINTVKQIDQNEIVLVLGAHFDKITSIIDASNITVIFNEDWEKGLGNSIACGIKYLKESLPDIDSVLIQLADQPLIDSNFLNKMIENYQLNPDKIICTSYQNKRLGVPAIFNKTKFEELSKLNHDKGAKDILNMNPENILFLDGTDLISDIDTIEDYETLYKRFH
jgi:molybdenum cofactor cytidylyltransferase